MGSMRSEHPLNIARLLVERGYEAYVDWHATGPESDDNWKAHALALGQDFNEALRQPHARQVYALDKAWLDWSDIGVIVMPCGKSAWAEMGFLRGQHKLVYALTEPNPERWDIMLQFANDWTSDIDELMQWF